MNKPVLVASNDRPAAAKPVISGVAEARHVANLAAAAFPAWSQTAPTERRTILNRAADIVLERGDTFARLIWEETGGTQAWSELNCKLGAAILREAAGLTTSVTGDTAPSERPGATNLVVRQPCGVVLSMAPWNAPIVLSVRSIATPLACGNTVVFKASELCPRTHQLIAEVFVEAGLPAGALGVVHNAPEDAEPVVEALIAHSAVRRVNFTGSTRIGRTVASIAARHLKKCLLELGGKAPLIVLPDADIDAAVDAAAFGAFFHQGQICMSTDRLIVHDSIVDAFVEKLRARAERIAVGDQQKPESKIGPMINEEAASRVKALIDDAVMKGAKLAAGGRQKGAYLDATILDHIAPNMRIYSEETFGPVASIIRYADTDEAVSIANDTEYGLAAAVFGRDLAVTLDVAKRLETGICHVNGATIHDEPHMPFGGVKASGYGRFGGEAAIEEFTEVRWISIQDGKQDYPI